MSFSGMVKEELSRQTSTARHCNIAETAALLSACGKLTARRNAADADGKFRGYKKILYIVEENL